MKSRAKTKNLVNFNKNSLVELNIEQLKTIGGGTFPLPTSGTVQTSSVVELLTSSWICSKD